MATIDLHTHTTASDGSLKPEQLVYLAKEKGLTAIAVTDHDTTAGIEAALQAGRQKNLEVLPGIEISTRYQGKEIHVLGYYIDFENDALQDELIHLREARRRRNEQLIQRLNQLGITITMEEVAARQPNPDGNIGRPHIAQVLVDKKVVNTVQEAFDLYLGEGGRAYVSTPRISPKEAVQLITKYGGIPVLAHPGLYVRDDIIPPLMAAGLRGLEVYHPDHSPADVAKYERLAERYGLLATGGSDFHGLRGNKPYHGELGSQPVGEDVVEQLKAMRHKKRV